MSLERNTTKRGDLFRDSVLQLIELSPGCYGARREYKVGSQNVDIYYEEQTSVGTLRVACECKDYAKPLTRQYIAREIYPRYNPLLEGRLVDAVRIIAPHEIGVDAQQYLRDIRFTFTTPMHLEAAIIDFRAYLRSLMSLYHLNGLSQYYIHPLLEDGHDLESTVTDWIRGSSDRPMAIIAGYGMGKSSFASRLAFLSAEEYLAGAPARIPIMIPLAEIASEQGLEGLLGKLLAAQNLVRNYHFGLFMELNRRGRFLIILDGFDEMKHMMSWPQFKHNFLELNRLVVPGSRVLLLGRPSAFLSDAEHLFVLRGLRKRGRQLYQVPGAADFKELTLQMFSPEQAVDFIDRYARYRGAAHASMRGAPADPTALAERLNSIRTEPELRDLIRRPVQAKMVTDLAIDPAVKWRSFSRYELYSEFLHRIIDRESDKPTRGRFSANQRHAFQKRLAWWVWRRSLGTGFQLDAIPDSLFPEWTSSGDSADPEGVRRDLIVGSVLDGKAGENYFFPHRSFLEFLVAEYISERHWDAAMLSEVDMALNPEISDFIEESNGAANVAAWANVINSIEAPVSFELLRLTGWAQNAVNHPKPNRAEDWATPRDLLIGYFRLVEQTQDDVFVAKYLRRSFHSVRDVQTRLMCLYAMYALSLSASAVGQEQLSHQIVALILVESLEPIVRQLGMVDRDAERSIETDPFLQLVMEGLACAKSSTGTWFSFDLDTLLRKAVQLLQPKWRMPNLSGSQLKCGSRDVSLNELQAWEPRLGDSEAGSQIAAFFKRFPGRLQVRTHPA